MTTNIPIYDASGKEVGTYVLDTDLLAKGINKQLLHDAVVMYQANLRQGSAKTKNRGEVAGCKKKMYRQKGTGNARAGHKRSGVRRGGGHIFAKTPRDWYYRLPRKALRSATKMALFSKFSDSGLKLIDQLKTDIPKTRQIVNVMKSLNIHGSLLIAMPEYDQNTYKSARNIDGVRILPVCELNAYEILKRKNVLMTKAALDAFVGAAQPVIS